MSSLSWVQTSQKRSFGVNGDVSMTIYVSLVCDNGHSHTARAELSDNQILRDNVEEEVCPLCGEICAELFLIEEGNA